MASTYLRRNQWWIKFQHPGTKKIIRESLETGDASRADLLRQRLELEIALLAPRFQLALLPERIRQEIGHAVVTSPAIAAPLPVVPERGAALPSPHSTGPRVTIDDAARCYIQYITHENAPETRANKISMLRRFLGSKRAERIVGPSKSTARFGKHRPKINCAGDVAFEGTYLDEVTASVVQAFIERLNVAVKTKRHYREFFHQFFEVCLRFDLYYPTSLHRPNPMVVLPSYTTRNRRIVFLNPARIEEQHAALCEQPSMQMAVDIMIHAGLRRSEILWLKKESIAPDPSFLSVVNAFDEDEDEEGLSKPESEQSRFCLLCESHYSATCHRSNRNG